MYNKNLNNKGVALVTVVLFFLVLVILLGGVMFSSISNQGNAMLSKEHSSAYYVAESGLNITIEKLNIYLNDNGYAAIPPSQYVSMMNSLVTEIESYDGQSNTLNGVNPNGTYVIEVLSPASNTYTLRSTGTVNGVSRTIEGSFVFDPILENMAKAVVAKSSITTSSGGSIIGPIANLMLGDDPTIDITCQGGATTDIPEAFYPNPLPADASIDYGSCPPPDATSAIVGTVNITEFTLPEHLDTGLKTIVPSGNTYTFPELGTGENGYYIASLPTTNMIFDLGSGSSNDVHHLYVGTADTGSFSSVGDIEVIGAGQLKVHVEIFPVYDKKGAEVPLTFSWGGNVDYNQTLLTTPEIAKFQLIIQDVGFVSTIPIFTIPNSNTFIGSLMMDRVNLEIGNIDFRGFIATLGTQINITSTAEITGPMWIYAPNADVIMKANGTINGSITANSVDFSSGATLEYLSYQGPLPPELALPLFVGGEPIPVGITFRFTNFKEV